MERRILQYDRGIASENATESIATGPERTCCVRGNCFVEIGETVCGRFITKENRFRCVVELDGVRRKCSIPGTVRGSELFVEGVRARVRPSTDPLRKTWGTLLMLEHRGIWVSVDSVAPNHLMEKAIARRIVPELKGYNELAREPGYGNHRLDFLLRGGKGSAYVEVKSVTLADNGIARFPGAPTVRGASHVGLLEFLARRGLDAFLFLVVQREDVREWYPNFHTDPEFSAALLRAAAAGVRVIAYRTRVTPRKIELLGRVPVLGREEAAENSGGYELVIEVRGDETRRRFGPGSPRLLEGKIAEEGYYIYSGNAERNLLQRVARHLGKGKTRRWHIDYLLGLKGARLIDAIFHWGKGRVECEQHRKARKLRGAGIPFPRFGSSDCRRCESHLVHFRDLPERYLRRLPRFNGEFL